MMGIKVPDWSIERAAELWARALFTPRFDNGDNSETGSFAHGMAVANSSFAATSIDDFKARIAVFRSQLVQDLKFDRDHHGEPNGKTLYKGHPGERPDMYLFPSCLSCDYHPDAHLAEAASAAGIPHSLFSWKSRVWMSESYVSASFGYGSEDDYHYPLSDGRWLICKLHGADMDKIISSLASIPGLTIEGAAAAQ